MPDTLKMQVLVVLLLLMFDVLSLWLAAQPATIEKLLSLKVWQDFQCSCV